MSVDVKALRQRLGLSQYKFSHIYGIPLDTVRHWEVGRRKPRGSTALLLALIERNPDLVEQVRLEMRSTDAAQTCPG